MLHHGNRAASYVNITNVSYTAQNSIDRADSATAFTFNSINIGSENPNRVIVIGVCGFRSGATLGTAASVTVAGNSATQVISRNASNDSAVSLTLWAIALPTGTTATIVVSHGSATTCGITVYNVISKNKQITPTYTSSLAYNNNAPATISTSIQTTTNSGVVAQVFQINGIDPTWTGVTKTNSLDIRSQEWMSGAISYRHYSGTLNITASGTANIDAAIVVATWI